MTPDARGYPNSPGGLSKIAAADPEKSAISEMVRQIDDLLPLVTIDTRPKATRVDPAVLIKQLQQNSRSLITQYAAIVEDTDEQTAGVR